MHQSSHFATEKLKKIYLEGALPQWELGRDPPHTPPPVIGDRPV